jgi:hypothetical protein
MPRPRIRPEKPTKPGPPPPSVAARVAADPAQREVLVEEALLLVGVALRLQMENLIIMRTLRERRAYDEESLIEALRGELAELIGEKRGEAERLRMACERAALRDGKGRRPDDYREGDVPVHEHAHGSAPRSPRRSWSASAPSRGIRRRSARCS